VQSAHSWPPQREIQAFQWEISTVDAEVWIPPREGEHDGGRSITAGLENNLRGAKEAKFHRVFNETGV